MAELVDRFLSAPPDPQLARLAQAVDEMLARHRESAGNPNYRGWVRLCAILREAKQDADIQHSPGASGFLDIVFELAADALPLQDGAEPFHELGDLMPLGRLGEAGAKHKATQRERAKRERPRAFVADGDAATRRTLIGEALRAAGPEATTHEVMDQLLGLLGAKGLPAQDEGAKSLRKIVAQDDEGNAVIFAFGTVQKTLAAIRKGAGAPQSKRGRPRKKQT